MRRSDRLQLAQSTQPPSQANSASTKHTAAEMSSNVAPRSLFRLKYIHADCFACVDMIATGKSYLINTPWTRLPLVDIKLKKQLWNVNSKNTDL